MIDIIVTTIASTHYMPGTELNKHLSLLDVEFHIVTFTLKNTLYNDFGKTA